MGLSEINSKNYKIILDKVKNIEMASVPDSPKSPNLVNANSIKREIKQQQKYLSDDEILEIVSKYKAGKSTYELAAEYGCHRYTISKHLKEAGVDVSNLSLIHISLPAQPASHPAAYVPGNQSPSW